MDDGFGWYRVGNVIVGLLVFISAWIYCISEYGFLWGFGFGWLPAAILATILAFLWPLLLLIIIGVIVFIVLSANGLI